MQTAISTGLDYSCAVVNGGVWCWGSNAQTGRLGNGAPVGGKSSKSTIPVQAIGLQSGVTAIHGNANHTCAIRGGHVWCWGLSQNGQIGANVKPASGVPVEVAGISGVTSIATGKSHTCAMAVGKRWCWGSNGHGQLGNESVKSQTFKPTPVVGPSAAVAVRSSAKLDSSRAATVATVACPPGGACAVTRPRSSG